MRTLEMKIAISEVKGGRCVSTEMKDGYILAKFEIEEETEKIEEETEKIEEETEKNEEETEKNETSSIFESELECRIDPNLFAGEWLNHQPTTWRQKETLNLYLDAKAKGRLHAFTCMTIDPSDKDGKLVYQKGLEIKSGFSQKQWEKMLKEYNPSRNSRQMTRTEYACRNLFLIQRLVESGYEIKEAWRAVCDDSGKIGHYRNFDNIKYYFEPTGSREVCGFCDLGNAWKFIANDPWDLAVGFWAAGGTYNGYGNFGPVADLRRNRYEDARYNNGVGMLALD